MDVKVATVVGAGVMGAGIAQELAIAGVEVSLHDQREAALTAALDRIEHGHFGMRRAVEIGKLESDVAEAALQRITPVADLAVACKDADVVVEAVYEDYALKIKVFSELDALTPSAAILASNTSGLSIAVMAAATGRPDKVIGWHFASPVPAMKLSEIVVTDHTSDDTRDTIVALAARCRKNPEVVKDSQFQWGFVANRVLLAVFKEADDIVQEGIASADQVDRLLKDCFRWPVGPFEMRGGTSSGWGDAPDGSEVDQRRKILKPKVSG